MMSIPPKRTSWNLVCDIVLFDRCFLIPLLAITVLTIVNAQISMSLADASSTLFTSIEHSSFSNQTRLLQSFKRWVAIIAFHYGVSALIDFMKSSLGIYTMNSAVNYVTKEITNMKNTEFHKRGQGKCHDDVMKISWSMHEVSTIAFVDIPSNFIYTAFQMYYFKRHLSKNILSWFLSIILISGLFAFVISWFVNKYDRKLITCYRNTFSALSDIFGNFDLVQAFGKEECETQRYANMLTPLTHSTIRFYLVKETFLFLQKAFSMIPHCLVLYLVVCGKNVGFSRKDIFTYNSTFMAFKKQFFAFRDKSFQLTKYMAEISCRLDRPEQEKGGDVVIGERAEEIQANALELRVDGRAINSNLSFDIKKGEKVAITGPNGTGKSTFIKTLLRFQECGGLLLIGGVPQKLINVKSLRRLFGYVPQDHQIMDNTVIYNLCYGQEKIDEEEVYSLCKEFNCHEFFTNLSNGYLTRTGEGGKLLSGGQKQRISLMRAIIRGSPIILMDEPTSNLDKYSEIAFIKGICEPKNKRTVIVILHNLDLLPYFNKILYFDKDSVQTYNSHGEFLKFMTNK